MTSGRQNLGAALVNEARNARSERFALAVLVVGVLASIYAGYLNPEYRVTASQLSALINGFAKKELMLPKTIEQLSRNFREFVVAVDPEGVVVGCLGIGNVYVDQGMWEDANVWYGRGLEMLGADPPRNTSAVT